MIATMSGIRHAPTNLVASKDSSDALQAISGKRPKLWKVKKPKDKGEAVKVEMVPSGDERRKRIMKRIGRENVTAVATNSNNNNNINNKNNRNKVNEPIIQGEEEQKQKWRRKIRRRRSENDMQSVKSPLSAPSEQAPITDRRAGGLLARARRALSERRHRSVSQDPPSNLSSTSNSREVTPAERPPPINAAEVRFRAGRGVRVVTAWGSPQPWPPDVSSFITVKRRGSLDSLGYPTSAPSSTCPG